MKELIDNAIYGSFISKRGVFYKFVVYKNGAVEQWKPAEVVHRRGVGGYKMGNEKFVDTTAELLSLIYERYGLKTDGVSWLRGLSNEGNH